MANFIAKSLTNKLIALFLAVSVVPIAIVGYLSYASGREAIKKTLEDSFTALVEAKEAALFEYLNGIVESVATTARNRFIQNGVERLNRGAENRDNLLSEFESELDEIKAADKHINELFILNTKGRIIASSDKTIMGQDKSNDPYYIFGRERPFIKDAYYSENAKKNVFAVSLPIKKEGTDDLLGILVARMDLNHLNDLTTGNREGMGETGEVYIVNRDGYMITESHFLKDTVLKQRVETEPVRLFHEQRKVMTGIYKDYRGKPVLGASMGDDIAGSFPLLGWIVLAEIDEAEAFAPAGALAVRTALLSFFIAALVTLIAFFVARSIAHPIKLVSEQMAKVGAGDLTLEIAEASRKDEIGILNRSFRQTVTSLKSMVTEILSIADRASSSSQQLSSTAQEMNATTEEVASTVQQIAKGTETQAQKTEETKKVMEAMASSAAQVAKSAQGAAGQVAKTADATREGSDAAKGARSKISEVFETILASNSIVKKLGERSDEIDEIVGVITNIADQTNLLALNAAIEAARAGEYGRGFAVVAEEVRKLAETSAKSANEIGKLIKEIQKETLQAVGNMEEGTKGATAVKEMSDKVGLALETIVKNVEGISAVIEQVAASGEEQAAGAGQASRAVADIASVAEETASATEEASASTEEMTASMEQMAASAQELADMGITLQKIVAKFKVGENTASEYQSIKVSEKKEEIIRTSKLREQAGRLKGKYEELKAKTVGRQAIDEGIEKINFQIAKSKHALWKTRMQSFMIGGEDVGEEELISPHACDLGKWLDRVGIPKFGKMPGMAELKKTHDEFHGLVSQIVRLKKSGDISGAEEKYKKLEPASQRILSLLDGVGKRVGATTAGSRE